MSGTIKQRVKWPVLLLSVGVFLSVRADMCFSGEAGTLKDVFIKGDISGMVGHYYEFVNRDAENSDSGWSTAYVTLKYETLPWHRLKFGTRFFAHGELYSGHDNGTSDPYETDIEKKLTLPELYLNYGFLDHSSVTAGRFNHKKVSHIDDAQSEGGYVDFKEMEDLEWIVGFMRRFAEIDYDDSEDFGRTNGAQDVDSEATYGAGSAPFVTFMEVRYQPVDWIKFNPYFLYHNGYAGVFGIDTAVSAKWDAYDVKYGGNQ